MRRKVWDDAAAKASNLSDGGIAGRIHRGPAARYEPASTLEPAVAR